jgi:23S rRNA (adenine2503-C2)-methyltransferase
MPVNRLYPLDELKTALEKYPYGNRRQGFFLEYILLKGINDTEEAVSSLKEYIKGLNATVNLIPYNPSPGACFVQPPEAEIKAFCSKLAACGIRYRLRKSKGADISAGCGQLAFRAGRQN